MKRALLFAIVILCVVSQTCTFEDYIIEYNRTYTGDQLEARRAVFNTKIQQIQQFNSQNQGFTLGCTVWTDRFDNELPRKIDLLEDDQPFSLRTEPQLHASETVAPDIRVSDAGYKDWRDDGGITSVKNQLTCGSCWSFGTVAAIESLFLIRSSQLLDFSQQYLLQCSGNNSCNGGSYNNAFRTVQDRKALPTQIRYPYRASDTKQGICDSGDFKTINDLSVTVNRRLTDTQMQNMIDVLPVSVVMIADRTFSQYKTGIYKCNYTYSDSMINHAVQVVGYNLTGHYYILKNSWGTGWGMGGYAYMDMTLDCNLKREVWKADGSAGATQQRLSGGLIRVGTLLLFILAISFMI